VTKLAEGCDSYDNMFAAIKKLVMSRKAELKPDQRNLFSVAYENVLGPRRASWQVIHSIEQKTVASELQ
jgi:14-3-3 protein epsilon